MDVEMENKGHTEKMIKATSQSNNHTLSLPPSLSLPLSHHSLPLSLRCMYSHHFTIIQHSKSSAPLHRAFTVYMSPVRNKVLSVLVHLRVSLVTSLRLEYLKYGNSSKCFFIRIWIDYCSVLWTFRFQT